MCERYLAAIDGDSAPARLVSSIRSLIRPSALDAGAYGIGQTTGGVGKLRALKALDHIRPKQEGPIYRDQQGHHCLRQTEPALLTRLRRHCDPRRGGRNKATTVATCEAFAKNAHFWRLIARATEEEKRNPERSDGLQFGRVPQAIHEKWFPPQGSEVAAIYLHMADLWEGVPEGRRHARFVHQIQIMSITPVNRPEIRCLAAEWTATVFICIPGNQTCLRGDSCPELCAVAGPNASSPIMDEVAGSGR